MFIDLIEPCCSMAQSKMESSRLKVDPSIGVMDLQKVLKHHVDNAPDRNIWNILKHPTGAPFSWKTSACLPWIAEAAALLIDFLKIAPNGLLPASKLRLSLSRLLTDGTEKTKKVNRTNYHTDDWVDQVDSRIRILLSQVRSLKKHEDYVRAMRRATESEKRKIDSVLSYVLYHEDGSNDAAGAGRASSSEAAPKSSLELVPYEPAESRGPDIFTRILSKQDSSPRSLKRGSLIIGGSPRRIWRGARSSIAKAGGADTEAVQQPMELGTAPIVGSASSSSEEVVLPKTQKPRPAASRLQLAGRPAARG